MELEILLEAPGLVNRHTTLGKQSDTQIVFASINTTAQTHTLYHNDPVIVDYWDVTRQPESVTEFLRRTMDAIVNPLEAQDDFQHAKHHPLNAVILNQYHNGDIIPPHSDDVKLSNKGEVDDLRSGTVVTLTLNASGVFYIEPSKQIRAALVKNIRNRTKQFQGVWLYWCILGI